MSREQTTTQWLRTATNRIATGSTRICLICARHAAMKATAKGRTAYDGVRDWLGESEGIAWLVKVAMLVGGGLILRKVLIGLLGSAASLAHSDSWRWLLWPAGAAWLIAAYRIGHPDWEPPAEPETPEESEADDPPAEPEPERGGTVTLLKKPPLPSHEDLHAALARVGTPHAHVAALAEALDVPADRVRQALTALSVPVEPVRMKGRGSSTGIRADRFPTPPPAPGSPSDGVVAAGQEANNNDNTVRVQRYAGGAHITVTPAQVPVQRGA
ncbi:hypothetical protein [Streptomyces sp. NPDC056921]|uniref:hypothetical protein n=1 Tax=Streptomyces sp. NPDC056921 TaxID=3345966 RepID=UPI00362FE4A3